MNIRFLRYNGWHEDLSERNVMPMPKIDEKESIGDRLARLRNERGYSQRDLSRETGISHRMIAYYEKQAQYPPTHVLPILAKALGISLDQLFGMDKIKKDGNNKDMRLWRRFSQIEKFDVKEKRKIIQLLDTFIENERLKQEAQMQ
jgi:transcriptional regulator with XRE-family HTH domain